MHLQNPSRSTDIRNWSQEWDCIVSQKLYTITNLKHKCQKLEKWECWIIPSLFPNLSGDLTGRRELPSNERQILISFVSSISTAKTFIWLETWNYGKHPNLF